MGKKKKRKILRGQVGRHGAGAVARGEEQKKIGRDRNRSGRSAREARGVNVAE